MQRIQGPTAVTSNPGVPALTGPAGFFTSGNPAAGTPATIVPDWWLNMIQEEILAVVVAAGLTPGADTTHLRQALHSLYGGSNEWVRRVLTEVGITPDVNDDVQLLSALHALYNGPKNWLQVILAEAGITPNPAIGNQVLGALNALFTRRSEFTNVLGNPGYMKTPGAMFQWGTAVSTSGTTAVVFPVAFPSAVLSVICTEQNAEGWGFPPAPTIYGTHGANRNGFNAYTCRIQTNGIPGYAAGLSFNWLAIGY